MMKRALSIFLTCVFLLGMLPTAALAAEADSGGLCPHHQEHSFEDCGYVDTVEGQPCGHVHDGDCGFVEAAEEIPCDMDCNETGEDSQIIHGEDCGYVPEVEGVPCQHKHDGECGYVCPVCPVQVMIDALPDAEGITPDNRVGVEVQLAAIDEARAELTDEEIDALDITRYALAVSALAALDGQAGNDLPMPAPEGVVVGPFTVEGGAEGTDYKYENSTLTILSDTPLIISGTTKTDKIIIKNGVTANVTLKNLNIDVSGKPGTTSFEVGENSTCNLTLMGVNTLKSGKSRAGLNVGLSASLTITENSTGSLDATGGENTAGIGGGYGGTCGTITINGGTVTATGGGNYSGAGIGGGGRGAGGIITINGGIVTARGGNNYSERGAGIGGGCQGAGGIITINGGIVIASGGDSNAAGIGGGSGGDDGTFNTAPNGNAFIIASPYISDTQNQKNWSGVIFEGDQGKVYGSPELKEDATIPNGKTLTIENGKTLTIASGVTLTNNGTIQIDQGGTISNSGTLTGNGTIIGNGQLAGIKASQTAPGTGEGYAINCTTEQITIENGYQVSSNQSDTITDGPIDPGRQLHVRKMENNFYNASDWTDFTTPSRGTTPSVSIDYVEEELNTTAAMQYVIGTSGHGELLPVK